VSEAFINTAMHEIFHALGLGHPAGDLEDSYSFTAMSVVGRLLHQPLTPQLYDISALQHLYGAADKNTGNDTYSFGAFSNVFSIWDTGGTDTLSAAGSSSGAQSQRYGVQLDRICAGLFTGQPGEERLDRARCRHRECGGWQLGGHHRRQ
jgi:hypothetical protein